METSSDEDFVEECYQKFLRRPADADGKAGFVAALAEGLDRLDLIQAIVSSPEYFDLLSRHRSQEEAASRARDEEAARIRREIRLGSERAHERIIAPAPPAAAPRLPWFIALNEAAWHFEDYARMARAAVQSALLNAPTLQPHLLYDGGPNELTGWMATRGVPVIPCRTRLYDVLAAAADRLHNRAVLQVGAGAFMRAELPHLFARGELKPRVVLYTDCDVLFLADVPALGGMLHEEPFAVGPEEDAADYVHINSGVMMMDLARLSERDAEFQSHCRENLESLLHRSWDQGAYQQVFAGEWARLDPTYNWKPYWNTDFAPARIVHFHGPKPTQLGLVERQEHPPFIQRLAAGAYFELAALWARYEALANA